MSVHYKFKSTLDFDTITFDGLHISVADLKKSIIQQKRLGKTVDFDLQITNAQTKEEYNDDTMLIPKNTSLTIARVPVKAQGKKNWEKPVVAEPSMQMSVSRSKHDAANSQTNVDLSMMNGSEEDKIREMMFQSTAEYDPTNYQKVRGSQTGEVPMNYKCYRCHKPGHWIKNCPMGPLPKENVEVKRTSGIPRSFIERDKDVEKNPAMQPVQMPPEEKQVIPEDLICSICKDLFTDAVMIPCCGSSFCDECVRTALLESEDNECPDCKEKGSSPGSLIPNRFLRNSVNAFRNETGYIKSIQKVGKKQVKPEETPTADSTTNSGMTVGSGTVSSTAIGPISTTTELVESSTFEDESARDPDSNVQQQLFDEISQQGDLASPAVEDKEPMVAPGPAAQFDVESDYEDNITVTVPPAHLQSRGAFRGHYNGGRPGMRHGGKPHGLDTPPNERQLLLNQGYGGGGGVGGGGGGGGGGNGSNGGRGNEPLEREEDHRRMMAMEEKEGDNYGPMGANDRGREYDGRSPEYLHGAGGRGLIPIPHNHPQQHVQQIGTAMGHPGAGGGMYMGPGNVYPAHGHGGHPHYGGGVGGGYGMQQGAGGYTPQQRPYDHHGGMYPGERLPRMMYPHQRGGYAPHLPHIRPRHMGPQGPMAGYPGIHQTIGPGIIDDPLEAFNRIMREKERRKEQEQQQQQMARRNRSPLADRGRRSRSFDNGGRGGADAGRGRGSGAGRGGSPDRRRNSRQRSPDRRRSPDDKHPDDRDRPRERRRNRSSSYSSGSSRSYSRSKSRSPMKRNKSPRKRSRSPPYRDRRSRSRSGSFGGGRYRDRRDDRRDDRRAGDFRDRSPGFNQQYGFGHRGHPRGGGAVARGGGGRARGNSRDHGGGMMMNAGGLQHYPPRGYDRHQPGGGGGGGGGVGGGHMHSMGGSGGGRADDMPPFMHEQNANDYRDRPGAHQQHHHHHGGLQTGASATGQPNRYPGRDERERSLGGYGVAHQHQEHYYDGETEHHMQQHHPPKGDEQRHRRPSNQSSPNAPHQREDARFEPLQRQHSKEGEWPEHSDGAGGYQQQQQQHSPKRHEPAERMERHTPDTKGSGTVRESADHGRGGPPGEHYPPAAAGSTHTHGRSRSRDRKRSMVASESGGDRGDVSERRRNRSKHSESAERREKSTTSSRGQRSAGDHEKDRYDRRRQQPSESARDKRGNPDQQRRPDERDHHHRDREKDRDRERERERDLERDRERDRDREKEKERAKEKERERDRERERERERERDRDRNPEHDRDRERGKEKERQKEKEREREKEREKERERKERDREGEKDRDAKDASKKKAHDSSDDERRDKKKERDKKKRKKEKEVEKRKHKKDRKEKDRERRSKDRRKERKTVEKEEPDSSQQPATPTARDREEAKVALPVGEEEREKQQRTNVDSTEEDRPQSAAGGGRSEDDDEEHDDNGGKANKRSDSGDTDEEEDGRDSRTDTREQQQEAQIDGHDHADLYSDIPDQYEEDQLEKSILHGDEGDSNHQHRHPHTDEEKEEKEEEEEEEDAGTRLADSTEGDQTEKVDSDGDMLLKRSDSVLDLHANLDFEQDLEDGEQTKVANVVSSALMPELSKWELDEETQIHSTVEKREGLSSFGSDGYEGDSAAATATAASETATGGSGGGGGSSVTAGGKVTSEVLKRAENAIFTRAINAIRPIEIKKISMERQKLYTMAGGGGGGGGGRDVSSPSGLDDELKRVQVTVPVNDDRAERSVEIKHKAEHKQESRGSPMRTSVKDRLGARMPDGSSAQYNRRSRTPPPARKGSGSGLSSVAASTTAATNSPSTASGNGTSNRNKPASTSDRRRDSSRSRSRTRDGIAEGRKRTEGDRAPGRHGGGGSGNNSRQQSETSRRGGLNDKSNDRQQQQQQLQPQPGRSRDRARERDRPNVRRGSRERRSSVSPPGLNRGMDKRGVDSSYRNRQQQQHPPTREESVRVSSSRTDQREDTSSQKVRQGDERHTVLAPSSTAGTTAATSRSDRSPQRDVRQTRKRSAEHLRDESGDRYHRQDEANRDPQAAPPATSTGNSGSSSKRSKLEKHSSKASKSGGRGGSSSDSSSSDSDSSSSDSSADTDAGGGGAPSAANASSAPARSSSKKRKKRKHKKDRKRAKRSASTDSDEDSGSNKRKKSKKKSSKSSKKKKKSSKHKKD